MDHSNRPSTLSIGLLAIASCCALFVPVCAEESKIVDSGCATTPNPAETRLRLWIAEQKSFPKKYELSQLMDQNWKSCAEITVREDGDYSLVLPDERTGNQLQTLSHHEAVQLWGRPWSHFSQRSPFEIYTLIALVDGEPSIFYIDLEFSKIEGPPLNPGGFQFESLIPKGEQKCLKYRVRGPGITRGEVRSTQK
jgi:hypothetical protein